MADQFLKSLIKIKKFPKPWISISESRFSGGDKSQTQNKIQS